MIRTNCMWLKTLRQPRTPSKLISRAIIIPRKEAIMPTRNTGILSNIVDTLGDQLKAPEKALAQLEEHFESKLLIVAGDVQTVARYADTLRLAITTPESAQVLDYIGNHALAGITIDQVEEVINALFPDRFQ